MRSKYRSKIVNSFQQVAEAQRKREYEYILMAYNEYEEKQCTWQGPDAFEK